MTAGAYGAGSWQLQCPPARAEVLVSDVDGGIVRPRQTYDELIARDPFRLACPADPLGRRIIATARCWPVERILPGISRPSVFAGYALALTGLFQIIPWRYRPAAARHRLTIGLSLEAAA